MNRSFFGIFIVVVVLALVAGLAVFGNDLLNPNTSAARADAIRQVTQSKTDKEAIDWAKAQQQVAIEWDKAQQALAFEAQRHSYELAQMEQRDQIANSLLPSIIVAAILATLVLSAALAYYLIQPGRSRWIAALAQAPVKVQAQAQAAQTELWNDLDWRTERILEARAHEAAERWVELARQAA